MLRVLPLIQLLLIQLQQVLCGRAEGKGAVHHGNKQDKSKPYSKQASAAKSLLSKAMSFAGCSWVPTPQCLAGFRHRPDSPSINSPTWQLPLHYLPSFQELIFSCWMQSPAQIRHRRGVAGSLGTLSTCLLVCSAKSLLCTVVPLGKKQRKVGAITVGGN